MLAQLPPALPHAFRGCMKWLEPRKLPALAAAGTLLLVILCVAGGSKRAAQVPLFDVPLHPTQAIEVERALLVWNEPFTGDAQYTQIYVSAARRRDVLLGLTIAGLPHRYVPTTADVLEQPPSAFAPPAFTDDRRRAGIEGDLVTSLRRMSGVADATVVIAPAIDDPLASDDARTPASASVQLLMQPGTSLGQTEIAGVKRFVAASYPGLAAERVVVVDGFGAVADASPPADKSISRESHLQNSIQSALDSVFGIGATVVRVSLRTADEERSSQRTLVTPHGLIEAERGSETGSDSGKRFQRDRTRTRYAYDTTIETRAAHADAVTRLSVAVFVDAHKVGLAQSKLVGDLVRAAAGAELGARDEVVVAELPFQKPVNAQPALGSRPGRSVAIAAAVGIVTAVIALLAWQVHRLPRAQPEDKAAIALGDSLVNELPQTAAYVLGSLPARMRQRVLETYDPRHREQILSYLNGRTRI